MKNFLLKNNSSHRKTKSPIGGDFVVRRSDKNYRFFFPFFAAFLAFFFAAINLFELFYKDV